MEQESYLALAVHGLLSYQMYVGLKHIFRVEDYIPPRQHARSVRT